MEMLRPSCMRGRVYPNSTADSACEDSMSNSPIALALPISAGSSCAQAPTRLEKAVVSKAWALSLAERIWDSKSFNSSVM